MPADLNELRKELDIVDVISGYINLEKSGNNYRASCPFHNDKTPSFYVSPSRQIFKCFGCGVGGDAIKFVALYENIPYMEAAVELARRYKVKLNIDLKEQDQRLYYALEEVSGFYHSQVSSRDAVEYLKKRGIGANTVKRFQIGFSPSNTAVVRFLNSLNLLEVYRKSKNLIEIDGKVFKDIFANRIIFPIRDLRGRVVGFGAGTLKGEQPKYINSQESEVFHKRKVLFGLYQALNYLKELKEVIVVEGYFDVLRMHEAGIRNVVAPLGTSLTREQAEILSRVVRRVFLMFDGDSAGQRAMKLAIPHLLNVGLEVYPVILPEGLDPDDAITKHGREFIKTLLKDAKELFLSLLDTVAKVEDKEPIIRDFVYYASYMRDEVRAYSLLLELSRLTNIPISVLGSRMHRNISEATTENETKLSVPERIFLKGLLELKPAIDLNSVNLSPNAYVIAEKILKGDLEDIPPHATDVRVENLKDSFEYAVRELLSPKIDDEDKDKKEKLRELVKQGGNRFRRYHG